MKVQRKIREKKKNQNSQKQKNKNYNINFYIFENNYKLTLSLFQ